MPSYIIKKNNETKEIIYMEYKLDGYKFTPRKKSEEEITIDEIIIVNPSFNDKILTLKFNKQYEKILKLVYYILNNDEADDGDVLLALDEIAKLRAQILNKYQDYLSYEKEMEFLEKLRDLENKLKSKRELRIPLYDTFVPNIEEEISSKKM